MNRDALYLLGDTVDDLQGGVKVLPHAGQPEEAVVLEPGVRVAVVDRLARPATRCVNKSASTTLVGVGKRALFFSLFDCLDVSRILLQLAVYLCSHSRF